MDAVVALRPWTEADLPILEANNEPEMTLFLGGPESEEKVIHRHQVFLDGWANDDTWVFAILAGGRPVGSIGYWPNLHHRTPIFEAGWSVHADFQGRGYGASALALCIEDARHRATSDRPFLYAFPRVDNAASNRICEKVGMTNTGEEPFEYPKGVAITTNAWMTDLLAARDGAPASATSALA
jgi:RimJ/RimL family protein N-acetyltransferase